jgi:hypothetical protein
MTLRGESSPKLVRSLLCLAASTILDAHCDVCSQNRGSGRQWNGGTPRHFSSAYGPSQLTFFFCFPDAALSAGAYIDAVVVFVAIVFYLCCVLLLGFWGGGGVCPEKLSLLLPPPLELLPNHVPPLLPDARWRVAEALADANYVAMRKDNFVRICKVYLKHYLSLHVLKL